MQVEFPKKKTKDSFEYPQHLYPKRKGLAKAFHMAQSFGHTSNVNSVAITHKGDYIISGSEDKTVKIRDFSTGNLLRTIEAHSQPILSVAISLDDNYIFSGSTDNSIKISGIFESSIYCSTLSSIIIEP